MSASLSTEGLIKRYGALTVTDDISLDIRPGELHAVIGPNGAGKTTLVNQLSGELGADAGSIRFGDADVTSSPIHARARNGLLRTYQITSVFDAFSVRENVVLAAMGVREHAFRFWRPMLSRRRLCDAADAALEAVGLLPRAEDPAAELAYGERRQLELAMALAAEPRVLLLDEPMAGMSGGESQAITRLLASLKGRYTIVLIEHDMQAVFALADRISVLVYGRILLTGSPDDIRTDPEVRATYLGDAEIPT